jgi:Rieske 2Fe-2S family protein
MPEDFDRGAYGLKRVTVRVFHGIILAYLGDGTPPEIEPVLADIEPFVRPYRLAEAQLAKRMTWEIQANWKLVIENFAECYHCGPAHPEYCAAMDHALVDGTQSTAKAEAFAKQTADWEVHARALGHHTGSVPARAETSHCAGRMPIGDGRTSQSRDGRPLAPLMGDFSKSDGGYTSFRIYPGAYFLSPCDFAVLCRFTPLSVNRTLQEMLWLVAPGAEAGRDFDVDELTWLWRVTTDQDLQIIEDNQRGVASRAYEPGPYSKAEEGPERFINWYLRQIAP